MSQLSVRLSGKLSVERGGEIVDGLTAAKVQQLLCYLLLRRDRPLPRESLAALLYGDVPSVQSKKYLRQALWQLQVALKCHVESGDSRFLVIGPEWVQLSTDSGLWLDVAVLESAHTAAQGLPSDRLDGPTDTWVRASASYLKTQDRLDKRLRRELGGQHKRFLTDSRRRMGARRRAGNRAA